MLCVCVRCSNGVSILEKVESKRVILGDQWYAKRKPTMSRDKRGQ
jgi:hypothetical protein